MTTTRPTTDVLPTAENTRTALLDAAEQLFSARGVDGTSVREITTAAGANVAAVSYYFGSKDGLVREVFRRRIEPLNAARLERLDAAEADSEPPALEAILSAFLSPALEIRSRLGDRGQDFARLMGRALSEPGGGVPRMLAEQFGEVMERFGAALGRALPRVPHAEIHWRLFFLVGSLAFVVSRGDLVAVISDGACDPLDDAGLLDRLVQWGAAGFRAAEAAS